MPITEHEVIAGVPAIVLVTPKNCPALNVEETNEVTVKPLVPAVPVAMIEFVVVDAMPP